MAIVRAGVVDDDVRLRFALQSKEQMRALVIAALETVCRQGELLSLQWREVRWRQHELVLLADKTKTNEFRIVPISPVLEAVLKTRETNPDGEPHPPEAYVFGNEAGEGGVEKVGSVKSAWRGACNRAGIEDLHFHDLRHEAGSRKADANWPGNAISLLLGHRDQTTTNRYIHGDARVLHRLMRGEFPRLAAVK